jgi:hypothetical protein
MTGPRHATEWERLTEASLKYAEASDDDREFMKARDRLRKAAIAYALSTTFAPRVVRRRGIRAAYVAPQLAFWPRPSMVS